MKIPADRPTQWFNKLQILKLVMLVSKIEKSGIIFLASVGREVTYMIMSILFPVMVSFTAWKDGFLCVLSYIVNGRAPL